MLERYVLAIALALPLFARQEVARKAAGQNPSPMTESARIHGRIPKRSEPGIRLSIPADLPRPVELFIPQRSMTARRLRLLLHFHGASYVAEHAVARLQNGYAAASVDLGSGSKAYGDAFRRPGRLPTLLAEIQRQMNERTGQGFAIGSVILSGFSAGYGAVRAILSDAEGFQRTDAVLLLDGLHAGYSPDGRVLAEGGSLLTSDLQPFLALAQEACRRDSRIRFLITHSEIFPGTFASTTETTDFLLRTLELRRRPVLAWGPHGMQLLSVARRNHFEVLAFAGNTAPDHVDHLHGIEYFVRRLMRL